MSGKRSSKSSPTARRSSGRTKGTSRKRTTKTKASGFGLFNFIKSNKDLMLVTLIGVLLIFTGIAAAMRLISKDTSKTKIESESTVKDVTVPENITHLDLAVKVKGVFFEAGVTKQKVQETKLFLDERLHYYIRAKVKEAKIADIQKKILYSVVNDGLERRYSDDINHLIFEGSNPLYRFEILFDEELPDTSYQEPSTIIKKTTGTVFGVTLPKRGKGKIAIVIDDAGANLNLADRVTKMKIPMTVAVLPHLLYSRDTVNLVKKRGKTVFLHFPMEPLSYPAIDPGEGAVLVDMPELLIIEIANRNVENLGYIDGFNNHTGSAFTENSVKMRQVLSAMSKHTDLFLDSRTTAKSQAFPVCKEMGLKCAINRKFLDNDNDHAYIASKLIEAAILAEKEGGIVAIGHLKADTIYVLEQVVPKLQELGYEFVNINKVLK